MNTKKIIWKSQQNKNLLMDSRIFVFFGNKKYLEGSQSNGLKLTGGNFGVQVPSTLGNICNTCTGQLGCVTMAKIAEFYLKIMLPFLSCGASRACLVGDGHWTFQRFLKNTSSQLFFYKLFHNDVFIIKPNSHKKVFFYVL